MALATQVPGGTLNTINFAARDIRCEITIPTKGAPDTMFSGGDSRGVDNRSITSNGKRIIRPRILPEITDTKKATYADTTVIGRSSPIKTYSHSDNRIITMRLHFMSLQEIDLEDNVTDLRVIESATYPREGKPYLPPPVCVIECGRMLGDRPLCVILDNYSVQIPNNVVWDKSTLIPIYFSVNLSWHVVYASDGAGLPNQERIFKDGV